MRDHSLITDYYYYFFYQFLMILLEWMCWSGTPSPSSQSFKYYLPLPRLYVNSSLIVLLVPILHLLHAFFINEDLFSTFKDFVSFVFLVIVYQHNLINLFIYLLITNHHINFLLNTRLDHKRILIWVMHSNIGRLGS